MATFTDAELESLLDDIESDRAERKESWAGDAPERGRQAICAFANDLPNHQESGVLFVGARDNGQAAGLHVTDQLLTTLADIRSDGNTLPPPSLIVEKRVLKGQEMAVVTVQPADAPPVRYRGRIWVRVGPSRRVATAQDERILNEKRRHRDLPFDAAHCRIAHSMNSIERHSKESTFPTSLPKMCLKQMTDPTSNAWPHAA